MNFDGRVVVVTGAGRGLGVAYARHFSDLGAHVVTNDVDAVGSVSHVGDLADPSAADALIALALERYGRIDALVNNAGIVEWATLPDIDAGNLAAHLAVHVNGTFNTVRAAWPHMVAQHYGRIVNTTSSGVFGLKGNLGYAAAKGAVIGMSRTMAVEGRRHDIKVNLVAPAAQTRLAGPENALSAHLDPALVAPMVAYLAHPDCAVTGEIYTAGAGRFGRLFIGATRGAVTDDVVRDWTAINDPAGYTAPADLTEWSAAFLDHLPPRE